MFLELLLDLAAVRAAAVAMRLMPADALMTRRTTRWPRVLASGSDRRGGHWAAVITLGSHTQKSFSSTLIKGTMLTYKRGKYSLRNTSVAMSPKSVSYVVARYVASHGGSGKLEMNAMAGMYCMPQEVQHT